MNLSASVDRSIGSSVATSKTITRSSAPHERYVIVAGSGALRSIGSFYAKVLPRVSA